MSGIRILGVFVSAFQWLAWCAGFILIALCCAPTLAGDVTAGEWKEKNQLVWDDGAKRLVSKSLRVWDAEPQFDLEFYWEPDPGQPAEEGDVIEGRGTLTWRRRGTPNYDHKAIFSTYHGDMHNGRPDGRGRMETHAGVVYDGEWKDGQLDGEGRLKLESGAEYVGGFRQGKFHGKGRFISASGEIYEGGFENGMRHGAGVVIAADGSKRQAYWSHGAEVDPGSSVVLARSRLRHSGAIQIELVTDARKNRQIKASMYGDPRSVVTYTHAIEPGRISIFPDDANLMRIWKLGGRVYNLATPARYDETLYNIPAFLRIRIAAQGSKPAIRSLVLQVVQSQPDLQPFLGVSGDDFLEVGEPENCVDGGDASHLNPRFVIVNTGLGRVLNSRATFSFMGREGVRSPSFKQRIGSFGDMKPVSIVGELRALGVDVRQLRNNDFQCPSYGQIESCRRRLLADVKLGRLSPYVHFGRSIYLETAVDGVLTYEWKDYGGRVHTARSPFRTNIDLAKLRVRTPTECGAGAPDLPQAGVPVFQLQTARRNYRLRYPIKRPISLSRPRVFGLGLIAPKSSNHSFRVVAELTDGRRVASLPVSFTYIRPGKLDYDKFDKLIRPNTRD